MSRNAKFGMGASRREHRNLRQQAPRALVTAGTAPTRSWWTSAARADFTASAVAERRARQGFDETMPTGGGAMPGPKTPTETPKTPPPPTPGDRPEPRDPAPPREEPTDDRRPPPPGN
jgi:hypothetical protein